MFPQISQSLLSSVYANTHQAITFHTFEHFVQQSQKTLRKIAFLLLYLFFPNLSIANFMHFKHIFHKILRFGSTTFFLAENLSPQVAVRGYIHPHRKAAFHILSS